MRHRCQDAAVDRVIALENAVGSPAESGDAATWRLVQCGKYVEKCKKSKAKTAEDLIKADEYAEKAIAWQAEAKQADAPRLASQAARPLGR